MRAPSQRRNIPALTPHPRTRRQSTLERVEYWRGMTAVLVLVLLITLWSAHTQIQELRTENATLAAQR